MYGQAGGWEGRLAGEGCGGRLDGWVGGLAGGREVQASARARWRLDPHPSGSERHPKVVAALAYFCRHMELGIDGKPSEHLSGKSALDKKFEALKTTWQETTRCSLRDLEPVHVFRWLLDDDQAPSRRVDKHSACRGDLHQDHNEAQHGRQQRCGGQAR